MRDQRAQVNISIFIQNDLVQVGNTRNVDQCIDPFPLPAFDLQNQVGAPGDNACPAAALRTVVSVSEHLQHFLDVHRADGLMPHTSSMLGYVIHRRLQWQWMT
jgi:hypothetical protein